jgi:hypothetical protein
MQQTAKRWSPDHQLKTWFIRPKEDEGQKRGNEAEATFLSMTEDLIKNGRLKWARAVSKASAHEDLLKGFDYRIRAVAGNPGGSLFEFSLLINVKSSFGGALEFSKRQIPGVYWIVVYPKMSPRKLRNALYSVYMREIQRLRQSKLSA